MEAKFVIIVGELHLADEVRNLVGGILRESNSLYKFIRIKPDLYKMLIIVPEKDYKKLLLDLSALAIEESRLVVLNESGDGIGTAILGVGAGYVQFTNVINTDFSKTSIFVEDMFTTDPMPVALQQ